MGKHKILSKSSQPLRRKWCCCSLNIFSAYPKKARRCSLNALTNPEVSIHGQIETLQKPFIFNSLCPLNRGTSWSLSPSKASSITPTSNQYQKQMFDENFSCFLSFSSLNPHWEVKVRKRNTIDVKGKARDEKAMSELEKVNFFLQSSSIQWIELNNPVIL